MKKVRYLYQCWDGEVERYPIIKSDGKGLYHVEKDGHVVGKYTRNVRWYSTVRRKAIEGSKAYVLERLAYHTAETEKLEEQLDKLSIL